MSSLLSSLDRATRLFWRFAGRPVDLAGAEQWLGAPMHDTQRVGDGWLRAAGATRTGSVRKHVNVGLLTDMSRLDGPDFTATELRPEIRDFYERTARWDIEVWARWNRPFRPAGELIFQLFGRRVRQLALPTRLTGTAHGMHSRIVPLVGTDGTRHATAWLRTLRSTGEYMYSGCYTVRLLPGGRQPSVHVAFPLEAGNIQVFLRPTVLPGGALRLDSLSGAFGENGAYVVVNVRGRTHAARVPIHETFTVYVDDEGVLRTDHTLRLWSAPVARLHYKLIRSDGQAPHPGTSSS